ncbi:hypothetical protein N7454_004936 [Penicillium verhagenii]|nr:hypothetical protein N7454_004936 [Penicillium verhagenii]
MSLPLILKLRLESPDFLVQDLAGLIAGLYDLTAPLDRFFGSGEPGALLPRLNHALIHINGVDLYWFWIGFDRVNLHGLAFGFKRVDLHVLVVGLVGEVFQDSLVARFGFLDQTTPLLFHQGVVPLGSFGDQYTTLFSHQPLVFGIGFREECPALLFK